MRFVIKKNNVKIFSLLFISLILALTFLGCNKKKEKKIDIENSYNTKLINDGKLKVGISPDFHPFEFEENGKLVGFDIDIAEMIGDDLGLEVEYVKMPYENLVKSVANYDVDVAISSIIVDSIKKNDVDFTTPYYSDEKVLTVGYDSPINSDNYLTYLKANSTKIAFLSASSSYGYVLKNLNHLQKVNCENYQGIVNSITDGKADISIMYKSYFDKGERPLKIIKNLNSKDDCAVAVAKHKDSLREAINKDFSIRLNDGTIDKLKEKWFYKD